MDPNQNQNQKDQELMLPPEDSLMESPETSRTVASDPDPLIETGVSYTPPQSWGGDQSAAPVGTPRAEPPQIPFPHPQLSVPTTTPSPSPSWTTPPETSHQEIPPLPLHTEKSSSPLLKTLLTGVALILFGTLLGVLASRFLPMSPSVTPTQDVEPTSTVGGPEAVSPTIEITPIVPTATPSSLLNLKWNMMTVKSPLTAFSSYRIYYPTTWSIKEYRNFPTSKDGGNSTLTLEKGSTTLTIRQAPSESSPCLFAGENNPSGTPENFGEFQEIDKSSSTIWRMGLVMNSQDNTYSVCEKKAGEGFVSNTTIGNIVVSKTNVGTIDEAKYILEKLIILTPTPAELSCGGITDKQCPSDYVCETTARYPDAMGICIPVEAIASYKCPANGWQDCMPILSEEGKRACSAEAMSWYKANCPDFKGAAL